MNLSTSLRSAVLKSSYRYFFWAVIVLIGFPLPMFLILYGIGKIWAFFGHSQVLGKWGWLEKFMITPTHHRLHHSCNADHLNSNFGETFLFWDRLFGTFKHSNEPLKYGIGQRINHDDFKEVVFHELRQMARELKDSQGTFEKVKILFGRPRAAVS